MTHYKQMELNLLSSQEAFHVKTSQLQENKKESSENDHLFGRSMRGSSKMYGQRGQLLKMYLPFDLKDLPWSYKISARSGTMQNGIAYPVPQLVGYTEEIVSGSSPTRERWATPTTQEVEHPNAELTESGRRKTKDGKDSHSLGLADQVQLWPTPQASDNRDRGHVGMPAIQRRLSKGKQFRLSMVVSETSGQLNPTWVEWLMGYPKGWTDLKD